jgi:hypothetical protein
MNVAAALELTDESFVAGIDGLLDEILYLGLSDRAEITTLLLDLIDRGIDHGEVRSADRLLVFDTFVTWFDGLRTMVDLRPETQPLAVEGFKRLLTGSLLSA